MFSKTRRSDAISAHLPFGKKVFFVGLCYFRGRICFVGRRFYSSIRNRFSLPTTTARGGETIIEVIDRKMGEMGFWNPFIDHGNASITISNNALYYMVPWTGPLDWVQILPVPVDEFNKFSVDNLSFGFNQICPYVGRISVITYTCTEYHGPFHPSRDQLTSLYNNHGIPIS